MALKVLGGLYLLWLAFQSARSALTTETEVVTASRGGRWFWRGLILNTSNPKSVISWIAAPSIGLNPEDGFAAIVAATTVCIAAGFFNNALYSVVFSTDGAMRVNRRARRGIDVVAGLFALASLGLIRSAFAR